MSVHVIPLWGSGAQEQLIAALGAVQPLFLLREDTASATLVAASTLIVAEGDEPYDHITLTLESL